MRIINIIIMSEIYDVPYGEIGTKKGNFLFSHESISIDNISVIESGTFIIEYNNESQKQINDLVPLNVLVTPEVEGGFSAHFVDYPGCITQGDDMIELLDNLNDALLAYFDDDIQIESYYINLVSEV